MCKCFPISFIIHILPLFYAVLGGVFWHTFCIIRVQHKTKEFAMMNNEYMLMKTYKPAITFDPNGFFEVYNEMTMSREELWKREIPDVTSMFPNDKRAWKAPMQVMYDNPCILNETDPVVYEAWAVYTCIISWNKYSKKRRELGYTKDHGFTFKDRRTKRSLVLEGISVETEMQGNGWGTKVLQEICLLADRFGCGLVLQPYPMSRRIHGKIVYDGHLSVEDAIASLTKWYGKEGFVKIGSERLDMHGHHEADWLYRKPKPLASGMKRILDAPRHYTFKSAQWR